MFTWEIIFVCVLLLLAIISFLAEKISADQTALLAFGALLIAGQLPWAETLPTPNELLGVFSNAAPITIAAMFVVSTALEKTGLIKGLANFLERFSIWGYRRILIMMILMVAFLSAFINNTPVVIIFMPIILSLTRKMEIPASKMLIPLSYASILGGTCTLVGTSTNILASGILESAGQAPLGMFELSVIGLPLLFVSTLYIVFIGNRFLPNRETITSMLSDELRREYITEAVIHKDSPLVGKAVIQSNLLKGRNVRIIDIIRNGVELRVPDLRKIPLEPGDRLILSCRPSGIAHARSFHGLNLKWEDELGLDTISAHEGAIVEGVIGPRSSLVGRSPLDFNFRQRYQMVLLAVHRKGLNLGRDINQMPFEFGDTLLMMGSDAARDRLRSNEDILLLDQPPTPSRSMRRKAPVVLFVMLGLLAVVSLGIMPIVVAAIVAMGLLFVTGCMTPKDGYAAVDWGIIVLIYGMLGLGTAMQSTGASYLIAEGVLSLSKMGIPSSVEPYVMLLALYLFTSIFTELLSNNATVVLMAPIAIELGLVMGIDPRPFVIAVCIASSASFMTPIGYQTNTYVYSVGGYKFKDFIKVGLPLNLLYCICTVTLVPIFWNL